MLSFASFFITITFLFCVAFTPAAAHFQLPNLELFTEIALPSLTLRPQFPAFNFDLEKALPPARSTLTPVSVLPTACAAYQGPGNDSECASGMAATAVTFEDCGSTFSVCRCPDANMTLETAVDRLARVPVGLRRFVGTVFVLGGETRAYTNLTTADIHFFGDCAMDTWIHEATHAFDYSVPTFPHSNSVGWEKATLQDTCVPDNYSLTNQVEDFAQMGVLKIYSLLHNGTLPPGFQSSCMQNQLNFMHTLPLYNATTLFGNTCDIEDGSLGVRRDKAPAVLDVTRTFATVPLDPTPSPSSKSALKKSASNRRIDAIGISGSLSVLSSVLVAVWFL